MSAFAQWQNLVPSLKQGLHKPILEEILALRHAGQKIYPPQEHIFWALECLAPQDVRCIILGQDPYHGAGQAQGLAFSVPTHTSPKAVPPSLKNIFKEICDDIYEGKCAYTEQNPSLERWGKQGVLLLNTTLTVQEGKAYSHAHMGWQDITQDILHSLAQQERPLAVLLWGKPAQSYAKLFQNSKTQHLLLMAPHPSPLSAHRGFLGCKHFSQVNRWLQEQGLPTITW